MMLPPPCCPSLLPAGAYGSTKRYKDFQRLRRVNDGCVIGAGGELSDFQYIMRCGGGVGGGGAVRWGGCVAGAVGGFEAVEAEDEHSCGGLVQLLISFCFRKGLSPYCRTAALPVPPYCCTGFWRS